MNAPRLIFSPRGMGSEVARIGDDIVAEIIPCAGNLSWITYPGNSERRQGPARNYESARTRIGLEVERWLQRIGWLLPGDNLEIVAPEKEHAA